MNCMDPDTELSSSSSSCLSSPASSLTPTENLHGWVIARDSPACSVPLDFDAILSNTLERVGTELVTLLVLPPGRSFSPMSDDAPGAYSACRMRSAVFHQIARIAAHVGELVSRMLPALLKKRSRDGRAKVAKLCLQAEILKRSPERLESLKFLLFELESVTPSWKFFCFCRCLQHAVHLAVQGSDVIDPSSFLGIDGCSLKRNSTTSFRMLFCTTRGDTVEILVQNTVLVVKTCLDGCAQRLEESLCEGADDRSVLMHPPCGHRRTRKVLDRWVFRTLPCFRGMAGTISDHMLRDFATLLRNPCERDVMIQCCFNCAFVLFAWSLGKYRGAHEHYPALAALAECRLPRKMELLMFPPQSYWIIQGSLDKNILFAPQRKDEPLLVSHEHGPILAKLNRALILGIHLLLGGKRDDVNYGSELPTFTLSNDNQGGVCATTFRFEHMQGADVRVGTCMSAGGWGIRYWIEPCVSLGTDPLPTGGTVDSQDGFICPFAEYGEQCEQDYATQEAFLLRLVKRYPTIMYEMLDAVGFGV